MTYDPTAPVGQVRLLINDTDTNDPVFTDAEVAAFLALEVGSVRMAAAQALDTIADDEALTSKVISTAGSSANGPAVADSLRKRAESLRVQAVAGDDGGDAVFEFVPLHGTSTDLTDLDNPEPWWFMP